MLKPFPFNKTALSEIERAAITQPTCTHDNNVYNEEKRVGLRRCRPDFRQPDEGLVSWRSPGLHDSNHSTSVMAFGVK